jgi:hypothetical protein
MYLKGSNGPDGPQGRPYTQLRIGQLIQGSTDPDPETGESKLWTLVLLEGINEANQPKKANQPAQEAASEPEKAAAVSEEVESL